MVDHRISVESQTIQTLLNKFVPNYYLPSIQRRWVWTPERVRDFFDSLMSQSPVGSIFIWQPDCKFPQSPLIDTQQSKQRVNKDVQYVLDGQQRLTALLLLSNNWEIKRGGETFRTEPISYNPHTKKLEVGKRGIDLANIFNAAMGDLDAQEKLKKESTGRFKEIYDDVGRKIADYPLPICIMESTIGPDEQEDVYEHMAKVFTQINSAGVKISNLEMFLSFFAGASTGETKKQITDLWNEYDKSNKLELEPFLRFLFTNMGLKQSQLSRKSFPRAMQAIKGKNYASIIKKSKDAINSTLSILEEGLGINDLSNLPSQNMLVPIFRYFYLAPKKNSEGNTKKILRWFIPATFNALYSSSANSAIQDDIDVINECSQSSNFPLHDMLNNMRQRVRTKTIEKDDIIGNWENAYHGSAVYKTQFILQCLLYRNSADDWGGNKLLTGSPLSVHHIFPSDFLEKKLGNNYGDAEDTNFDILANLTLIHEDINSEIGNTPPAEYLPKYKDALPKHFISENPKHWKIENYETFLEKRQILLYHGIKKMLDSLG